MQGSGIQRFIPTSKVDVLPHQILGIGEKKFQKFVFMVIPYTRLVCKFRGDALRDGRDALSVKKYCEKNISRSKPPYRGADFTHTTPSPETIKVLASPMVGSSFSQASGKH